MLVFAALALAQAKTVSFTCRAEPMLGLVDDLGKAIGRKLSVSTECESDVMLISVQKVSADRLLQEIAKVDAAAWVQRKDSLQLVPDRAAQARQKADGEQRRILAMRRNIAKFLSKDAADLQRLRMDGSDRAEMGTALAPEAECTAKVTRGLISLLSEIDLSVLPADESASITFSSRPNAVQQPLGPNADATIDAIVQAYNAYAVDPNVLNAVDSDGDPVVFRPKPVEGYAKADLIVSYAGMASPPEVRMKLYDSNGQDVSDQSASSDLMRMATETAQPKDLPGPGTPIEHNPATLSYGDLTAAHRKSRFLEEPFPPLLRPYLLDPLHHDALALLPSDQLLALAKAAAKPIVALVPDNLMQPPTPQGLAETEEQFETGMASPDSEIGEAISDGWIEVSPTDPELCRQARIDRRAVADLFALSRKQGIPTLDDLAALVAKIPVAGRWGVWFWVQDMEPEVRPIGYGGLNAVGIRLWEGLDAAEKQRLLNGGAIPLAALPGDLTDSLASLIYTREEDLLRVEAPSDSESVSDDDLEPEPTEALPNGIPSNAYVTLTSNSLPCAAALGYSPSEVNVQYSLTPSAMASLLFRHETGQSPFDPAAIANFRAMGMGTRTTYELMFHFTPRLSCTANLVDDRIPADGEKASLVSLPKAYNDALQEMLRLSRELRSKGSLSGEPGQGVPPPH